MRRNSASPTSDKPHFQRKGCFHNCIRAWVTVHPKPMPSVLIADDNPFILDTLAGRLRRNGHDVIQATNGQEAIDRCAGNKPDVAILDVSMPVMNGLEAAKHLREMMPTLPIILFTAYGDLLQSQTEQLGVTAVFDKSSRLSDLLDTVEECWPKQQK